jgi:hypothetical protein
MIVKLLLSILIYANSCYSIIILKDIYIIMMRNCQIYTKYKIQTMNKLIPAVAATTLLMLTIVTPMYQHAYATGPGEQVFEIVKPLIAKALQELQNGDAEAAQATLQQAQNEIDDSFNEGDGGNDE